MQINYKIKLKNPVAGSLQVSEQYSQKGSFTVERKASGILIKGFSSKNDTIIKAYSHSFLGEDYSLTETDTLSLKTTDHPVADIEEIFEVLGENVVSTAFSKVQPFLRKVIKTPTSFKTSVYVEKSSDVFLLKINSEGYVSTLKGAVQPFSNSIKLDVSENIQATDILVYALISKPLKLETDDSLFISAEDALKCPQGFCTIGNQVFHKTTNSFETLDSYSVLGSTIDTPLWFSTEVLVDGLRLSTSSVKANEKVVLETDNALSKLNLNNLSDNVTLIYEVGEDTTPVPYLAVVGKKLDLEYNSNSENLLTDLMSADTEFKKKYLCKEYKILINTAYNQYSIFNSKVLETLLNTDEFLGCILKYEQ